MADCRFENFDIAVHGQADPYLVRASYAGYSAESTLAINARQPAWAERLARLSASARAPGRDYLEQTGSLLHTALWRDQVRDLWLRARGDLESGSSVGVRIRLSLTPPEVAALPWEALYDTERGAFLAAASQTPVGRVVNLLRYVGAPRSLAARLPLRVLVALPEDATGVLDTQEEWRRLQAALAPVMREGLELRLLDGRFGLLELRRRLEQDQPHILHLVTHGRADGVLVWQEGQPQLVAPTALRLALDGVHSLRLVLLAACSTAQVVDQSPLSSLGAQLLQTGAPAVIAMQVDVRAAAAATFSEYFYLHLLAGHCPGLVDVAVNYARSCVYLRDPDQFAFGAPVLWLNAPDGRIFIPDRALTVAAQAHVQPLHPQAPAPGAADADILLAELAALEGWLDAVPAFERRAIPPDLRTVEAGRRKHLQDVRDLLALLPDANQPTLRAMRFAEQRAALQEHRDHIDRLTVLLRDHLRNDPGTS